MTTTPTRLDTGPPACVVACSPPNGTLYAWFEESARQHSGRTALEVGEHEVTYADLADWAQRLATRLVEAAGHVPRTVGILASRNLASYVAYLAGLRLSATVVPLSPGVPAHRNRLICSASGVDVLVSDVCAGTPVGPALLAGPAAVVELRAGKPSWHDDLPAPWPEPLTAGPDDVAYTLFTSGSTGAPKGVPIRHRNLETFLSYSIDRFEVGPESRLSQTFQLNFDPSVFDMFVAWLAGATLVVAQPEDCMTPAAFVNNRRITHWSSVPSVVSIAKRLRALRPNSMPDLQWSLFCGEQLTLGQARSWAEAAPRSVVENLYGPTELTITCTGYRLPADPAQWPRTSNDTVPIGRVYPHLEGVVLAEDRTETDDGELCLRGVQRFDGYVDAAQDDGRFLRHDEHGTRPVTGPPMRDDWYRTGDRVRVEDGHLVHHGRRDLQVKIHGYRVELGEIESVLRGHDGIDDVVVLALPADGKETILSAVYTGNGVNPAELAQLTERQLPSYMCPSRYMAVEQFPLNLNGKIDRRALAVQAGPVPA